MTVLEILRSQQKLAGFWATALFLSPWTLAFALTFELPEHGDLIGKVQTVKTTKAVSLQMLGKSYGIGPMEMRAANPGLPKIGLIPAAKKVTIPAQFVLPKIRNGIVINLAEFRLYFFPESSNRVETYPVAIGRIGTALPFGQTSVSKTLANPAWYPPELMRSRMEGRGKILPKRVAPGPDNPLGHYAIYLELPNMLIHGTNEPMSVGLRSSSGCFRMDRADIAHIFERVSVGTSVTIINEPVQFGIKGNEIYLKMTAPLAEEVHNFDRRYDAALDNFFARESKDRRYILSLKASKAAKKDGLVRPVGTIVGRAY